MIYDFGYGSNNAPFGIVVNGIAPGEVATGLINWNEGDSINTEYNHFGRMAMPEEVANLALFW